jgi:hypothetical protein
MPSPCLCFCRMCITTYDHHHRRRRPESSPWEGITKHGHRTPIKLLFGRSASFGMPTAVSSKIRVYHHRQQLVDSEL